MTKTMTISTTAKISPNLQFIVTSGNE
jgi:hypothetical protein